MVEEMVGAAMAVFDEMIGEGEGLAEEVTVGGTSEDVDGELYGDMEEEEEADGSVPTAVRHDIRLPEISSEMWGDADVPDHSHHGAEDEGRDDTPDFAVPSRAVAGADPPRPDDGEDVPVPPVLTSVSADESGGNVWTEMPAAPLDAGDAALAALDGMVGTLLRSLLDERPPPVMPVADGYGRAERRRREIPPTGLDSPRVVDLLDLPRALSDFGDVIVSESLEHRRLSEGEADPRSEVKERIGRRLTEYLLMTETYLTPGGGSITFHTASALPDLASLRGPPPPSRKLGDGHHPRLGFATPGVDRCIHERYLGGALSPGCSDAVAGFRAATAAIRDRRASEVRAGSVPAAGGGPCGASAVAAATAGVAAVLVALRCLGAASVLWSLALAVSVAAFGYWSLLVAVPLAFLFDYLGGDEEEDDGEGEEADFDYHQCPGGEEGQGQGQQGQHDKTSDQGRQEGRSGQASQWHRRLHPTQSEEGQQDQEGQQEQGYQPPQQQPPAHGEHAVYVGVPIQIV